MQCFCLKTLVVFFILCAFTNGATAACLSTSRDGTVTPVISDFAMLDTEDGGVKLGSWSNREVYVLLSAGSGTCPAGMTNWSTRPAALPAKIGTITVDGRSHSIFPTEYQNIGYVVLVYDQFTHALNGNHKVLDRTAAGTGIRHQVQFVFLGQILPGTYTLARRQIARAAVSSSSTTFNEYVGWPVYYNGTSFTVTGNTCTIDAGDKNKTVTMPSVNKNQFGGVGSKVGAQSFSIKLECGASVTVSAGMTDVSLPSNSSNILTLSSDSTAAGVGYQLHANNSATPVIFGSGADTKNLWSVGGSSSTPATTYDIPFTASYVQTDPKITGGTANAMSTILLSYK